MTRRAKERRQERVQEKQRAMEERLQREAVLSTRPDWRALLRRIDGDDAAAQAVVSPRHQVLRGEAADGLACDPPRRPPAAAIAEAIQWKSTHVPIAAASVFQLPIKVDAPLATLQYEFSTKDFDVNFGIQAVGADGAMREVRATARYESQKQSVKGELQLEGPAMVLLLWDNSFSWLNTKQLAYSVELKQDFPDTGEGAADAGVTPEQRASLALHERAKRERLRTHRESSCEDLQSTITSHDQQIEFIKYQIEELRKTLETTEALKRTTMEEQQGLDEEIEALTWEIDALLWRSMGTRVIENIFAFCPERELAVWSLTNHQWHQRVTQFRAPKAAAVEPHAV